MQHKNIAKRIGRLKGLWEYREVSKDRSVVS